MAFMLKNRSTSTTSGSASKQGYAFVEQIIHTQCPARTLPATTTDQIFRVRGGRVLVKGLVGEVTTATGATATNLKVSSKKLDTSSAAVGTAVDVGANVSVASLELGAHLFVEGDGTAVVSSTAGAAFIGPNSGYWIAPQGEIYLTTSATNTGATKWDIYYQPLDEGAYVEPVVTATAAI